MKTIGRIVTFLVILLVVLIAIVVFARNSIVKYGGPVAARLTAGLKLAIDDVDIGFPGSYAGLMGITVNNPSGFPDEPMISAPEVYVDYTIPGLLGRPIHLEELRLNVDQIVIVRNADGRINVKELLPPSQEGPGEPGEPSGPPEFKIDLLTLKIGKVIYKDYTAGNPPREQVFTLNIDEQYTDVSSTTGIAALIVGKALMSTTLNSLSNLDLQDLTRLAGGAFGKAGTTLGKFGDAATAVGGIATNIPVKSTIKGAGEALRKLF
jgi:uncharacterized protein involved in outer membrane biogenesis